MPCATEIGEFLTLPTIRQDVGGLNVLVRNSDVVQLLATDEYVVQAPQSPCEVELLRLAQVTPDIAIRKFEDQVFHRLPGDRYFAVRDRSDDFRKSPLATDAKEISLEKISVSHCIESARTGLINV